MQDEVVRGAVADVGVAVQVRTCTPESAKRVLPSLITLSAIVAVLAVVDQREMHGAHRAGFAARGDRQRELAQAALEELQIRDDR